ncbi:hypothetical protein PR048_020851 [Dryococelus australis]|uniref:Uncharacterized protein n=1 Tax=Dryococelus australis TaxID=614101 RepID=A0ABQ9GWK4_9NEOP|nr:hypothetical protein PR048_020851 [Dryococelus australis]
MVCSSVYSTVTEKREHVSSEKKKNKKKKKKNVPNLCNISYTEHRKWICEKCLCNFRRSDKLETNLNDCSVEESVRNIIGTKIMFLKFQNFSHKEYPLSTCWNPFPHRIHSQVSTHHHKTAPQDFHSDLLSQVFLQRFSSRFCHDVGKDAIELLISQLNVDIVAEIYNAIHPVREINNEVIKNLLPLQNSRLHEDLRTQLLDQGSVQDGSLSLQFKLHH